MLQCPALTTFADAIGSTKPIPSPCSHCNATGIKAIYCFPLVKEHGPTRPYKAYCPYCNGHGELSLDDARHTYWMEPNSVYVPIANADISATRKAGAVGEHPETSARKRELDPRGPRAVNIRELNPSSGKPFDYAYALNYVHRCLTGTKRSKPTKEHSYDKNGVKVVHDRKRERSGSNSHIMTTVNGASAVSEHSLLGSFGYTESIQDIVQEAYLYHHQLPVRQRRKIIDERGRNLTTISACRHAIQRFKEASRGQGKESKSEKMADYLNHLAFAYDDRKSMKGFNEEVYDTIVEWLETGATQADVAKALGIDRRRVSEYVDTLRKTFSPHTDEYSDTIPDQWSKEQAAKYQRVSRIPA